MPQSRFTIDDNGIIPLMSANTEFTDNITLRFKTWLGITFGEELLVDNLNFIEKSKITRQALRRLFCGRLLKRS